jgi:hypothetical protein
MPTLLLALLLPGEPGIAFVKDAAAAEAEAVRRSLTADSMLLVPETKGGP